MNHQPSPIETLRQLREMLDAGTITPAEFEQLKQQLIFAAQVPAAPVAGDSAPAAVLAGPVEPHSPLFADARLPAQFPDLEADEVVAGSSESPSVSPLMAPGAAPVARTPDEPTLLPARNPLNLVLAIGGLVVLLAVFAYLAFNQHASEHISSNTLTAADSVQVVEEGPQAATMAQPVAPPETVRVAPTNPAPPIVKPAGTPAPADSAAAAPGPAADSAQRP